MAGLKFEQAVHHIVLEDYIATVEAAQARRDRLTAQIEAYVARLGIGTGRGGAADTKAGNSAARRLLIEAAWTYRFPARVSRELRLRQEAQVAIAPAQPQLRFPGDLADRSPAAASQPMSSLPQSLVSWQASSGPSPGARRRRWADRRKPGDHIPGRRQRTIRHAAVCNAGGAVAVRITLASTICRVADPTQVARPRQLRDASTVMRFRPAHQSMINRAQCAGRQDHRPLHAAPPPSGVHPFSQYR